jgi:hypothetical protein
MNNPEYVFLVGKLNTDISPTIRNKILLRLIEINNTLINCDIDELIDKAYDEQPSFDDKILRLQKLWENIVDRRKKLKKK